jgi:polar amino acid transport system ATP-binding protein
MNVSPVPDDKPGFALVDIRGLRKRFGDNEVLKGVDLQIARKEVVCIIGKSGSGKSTLLRCMNGLEAYQQGSVTVDGQRVCPDDRNALRELRQNVGMIFQGFNLFPHLSAGQNVMLAPRLVQRASSADAERHARKLLTRVGLGERFDAFPDQLSGGQQQRVAIARSLAMNPQVVEGLAREGMTLIMVTHEMAFARRVSDRVVFMHQGLVHESGDPETLFSNPRTPELRRFLSTEG